MKNLRNLLLSLGNGAVADSILSEAKLDISAKVVLIEKLCRSVISV
jgi:hypothetical protein